MTNQTKVFSYIKPTVPDACLTVTGLVNGFIASGIPLGYTNFCIRPAIITPQYLIYVDPVIPPTPSIPYSAPSGNYWCTVEVSYYDPSIM